MLGGEFFRSALADETVHLCGHLRGGRLTGADGPHWFVRYQNTGEFIGGQRTRTTEELVSANVFSPAAFAVFQHFPNAYDRSKAGSEGGFRFLGDGLVGFSKKLAPFGMADDDVAAAGFDEHLR